MKNLDIEECIRKLGNKIEFIGKADDEIINSIEKELDVILPDSYKRFLKEYGLALFPGYMINGNGLAEKPGCVKVTLDWRNFGLPKHLVVIEDEGTDFIYCLDTSAMKDKECPVVDWMQNSPEIGIERYESFSVFFKTRLEQSLSLLNGS